MTMYEDAFFSLTDYQSSPAEVLFFPKIKKTRITWKVKIYAIQKFGHGTGMSC
jgi:hypothetical protein